MHQYYADILDKLGEPPWWDECAVPRYCEMTVDNIANIYALEVAFMEIACQNCGHKFIVAMSSDIFDQANGRCSLSARIMDGTLHYGDPPNVDCCAAGPTENCDDLRVIEFWHKGRREGNAIAEWCRDPRLEGKLPGWEE
jgi:DNA-directed RNA polymerase subunit RPC12/RpoP